MACIQVPQGHPTGHQLTRYVNVMYNVSPPQITVAIAHPLFLFNTVLPNNSLHIHNVYCPLRRLNKKTVQ